MRASKTPGLPLASVFPDEENTIVEAALILAGAWDRYEAWHQHEEAKKNPR